MALRHSIRWLTGWVRWPAPARGKARVGAAIAALWLGQAAQAAHPGGGTAVNQLDAIRERLQLHDQAQAQQLDAVDTLLGIESGHIESDLGDGLVAQWFNWPNWGNWANWNNWNNWGNWRNF
jgi:hypothetical protein